MHQNDSDTPVSDEIALNYHLMHPGGDSAPGDPNAAFCLDGTYHLHYILRQTWHGQRSYCFVHVTSPDMLNWTWQTTKLQPSFTGHGMYSGTGFITREGAPAVIYHGQASGRNYIAVARDRALSAWKKPHPINPKTLLGEDAEMHHWDPDCFVINDTYYAISGGIEQPIMRSQDLVNWSHVGNFLKHEMPEVAIGEDISCPNFFRLGDKWVLLCISHPLGCRYYVGDWDADAEQFVPEIHGRMNWRRPEQSIYRTEYRDYFAPESVLTTDGRRVMWAWIATLHEDIFQRTVQALPRELILADDNTLRIRPLQELERLRYDLLTLRNVTVTLPERSHGSSATEHIADLEHDAYEIKITVDPEQTKRKRFGFQLFADEANEGLSIMVHPENGTLRIGTTESPFAVADLPETEALELRIFVDKYVVEVFANERQAVVGVHMDYRSAHGLKVYTYGDTTIIREINLWKLKPTNQGFLEARENRIWLPEME